MEIIPAIMPKSMRDLKEKMSRVAAIVPLVQVDIMDGIFVSEKTWPYGFSEEFKQIIVEKEGFPFWDQVDFEADLMISDPVRGVEEWISAGARRVIVHIESTENFPYVVDTFKSRAPAKDSLFNIELGVAINPDTPNEKIAPYIKDVDFVQCMGIAKIGFQSQPF
ncbi:hypothetical protein KW783_03955, partial [Candidatus Parcubacteria bacterium]|nr:hypothetical protein [Candidatus Parcubacteria bacterium]